LALSGDRFRIDREAKHRRQLSTDFIRGQSSCDVKATKAKLDDFVDLHFVEELKQSGFIDRLYKTSKY